jgi:exodeoxyribonuclease-3
MKLATWNVNSLKARLPRVLEFLEKHEPDVLCVQETKVTPENFPHAELGEAGYHAVDSSGGQWAGVAVLAPADRPLTHVSRELPGAPLPDEARWIEATVGDLRVASAYVINGRALDDPMFEAKLSFLDAMAGRTSALAASPLFVAGDFNIAPANADVYDPKALEGHTHVSPEERERLGKILATGLVDAFRHLEPEKVQYTWWDYRGGNFHRGLGLRIDLALVSSTLAPNLRSCGIDRDFRKGPKPSDHAPLIVGMDP